jgi:phage terminase large subunit-like protein
MSLLDALTKSLIQTYTEKLSQGEQSELLAALEVLANDQKYNKLANYLPDSGEYRRELYPKHIDFFNAGAKYRERFFVSGNRVGKSEAGTAETVYHLTGEYPAWWQGKRYAQPILAWVGGDTATTCRDIIQKKFLGDINDLGSGMIPKEKIVDYKTRRNVPDAVEIIRVKHVSGGVSTVVIKTYEQGRATWQGTEVDWIFLDEEPPEEVYGESLIRLMTTDGSIIVTFTPLQGVTPLVLNALENAQDSDAKYPKYVQVVTWGDVPHITEAMKEQMLQSTPPQLREARSKGVPTVGSGLIYPVDLNNVTVDDFKIPMHFQRLYALDVGWNVTCAIFGAWDRDNDIIYIYSEHYQGEAEPVIHAKAIKARGEWIKGVIDPAARGRSQVDGENLYNLYRKEGLKIYPANNAVESGIFTVWERLTTGRLKIFKSCTKLLREFSLYHRDDKGRIVKTNDHGLDSSRYLLNAESNMWSYPAKPQMQQKVVDFSQYMKGAV